MAKNNAWQQLTLPGTDMKPEPKAKRKAKSLALDHPPVQAPTLIHGSAHNIPLPDQSVQCIVTSPPYWGLRKYAGAQGIDWPAVEYAPMPGLPPVSVSAMTCELGLEPDLVAYIGHLILCLREWRRILRSDGTLWLNLGDSYASAWSVSRRNVIGNGSLPDGKRAARPNRLVNGLKEKDLVGTPWRVAFAAQADGWFLRADVIWAKLNPLPDAATDRPSKAHEYIFLFTKQPKYFYDADAVREPHQDKDSITRFTGQSGISDAGYEARKWTDRSDGLARPPMTMRNRQYNPQGRNRRSVWTFATQPTPMAHFATFPEKLVEPCVLAGTSAKGCCPTCGAPWRRVVERTAAVPGRNNKSLAHDEQLRNDGNRCGGWTTMDANLLGWQPSCTCPAADPVPCVVMDPFGGSNTTGVVALRLGRAYVGVDTSEEYLTSVTQQRFQKAGLEKFYEQPTKV